MGAGRIFPEGTIEEARRQGIIAVAITFIAIAFLTLLAQASYDPLDPSLNTASGRQDLTNWLGLGGAIWADLGFQWFGYCFYLVGPYLLLWGALLIKRDRIGFATKRLALLPLVLALCAGFLTFIDIQTVWSKPRFAGGAIGELLLGNAAHWLRLPEWFTATLCLPIGLLGLGWLLAQPLTAWQRLSAAIAGAAVARWR